MFDLEQAIVNWRKQMLAGGINSPVPLEELESHLREETARQVESGLASQDAFNSVVQKIGGAPHLKVEFNKVSAALETRLVTLAGAACFVVALFFSLWTLPFLFHHETGVLAKISGLAAVVTTILSWRYNHKFLPIIRNPFARTAAGLACWLGCVAGMLLFIIYFLPYMMLHPAGNEIPAGQLMAVFLWGWAVMATLGGVSRGLEKAAAKTPPVMFNLEQSITDRRRQMLAAGIKAPVPLEELEIHLRQEIDQQVNSGTTEQVAFEIAVEQMGKTELLKTEFIKISKENWNRPLAWLAWGTFAVSFFLPAFEHGWGWQCASLSATAVTWAGFWHNWMDIHLAPLTLANLLMVASPLLFFHFAQHPRLTKWVRCLNFAALTLVWSFLVLLTTDEGGNDLKIGGYIWGLSFLFLCLSTLKLRSRQNPVTKYA